VVEEYWGFDKDDDRSDICEDRVKDLLSFLHSEV
jgi:hypothetical protein